MERQIQKTHPLYHQEGYEALVRTVQGPDQGLFFTPHPAYNEYLRMHKVFVGGRGAKQLLEIHESLSQEEAPRYLSVAGWAAVESALIQDRRSSSSRMNLFEKGIDCWRRALGKQKLLNQVGPEHCIEHSTPYRIALNLAVAPVLKGVIVGNVTESTCKRSYEDCLNIAQANEIQLNLAAKEGHTQAVSDHSGFGYECNALLSFNRQFSGTWFAIPSMARSGDGCHHERQTHDLLVIHQKWGELKSVIPVEIKAAASRRDRQRYHALLVRGKMHLSAPGKYTSGETLKTLTAVHEGDAIEADKELANTVTGKFVRMVKDYYLGEKLGSIVDMRSPTTFRDNEVVISRHQGLSISR